jgi:hypothetical protein
MISKKNLPNLIRKFLVEMAIYAVLLVIYFFAVLQFLGDFLSNLYDNYLFVYAFLGLTLIVVQAVLLEALTSFLMKLLRLEK